MQFGFHCLKTLKTFFKSIKYYSPAQEDRGGGVILKKPFNFIKKFFICSGLFSRMIAHKVKFEDPIQPHDPLLRDNFMHNKKNI